MFENRQISAKDKVLRSSAFFLALGLGLWIIPRWVEAIVAIGVVIMVHELSHFIVGRLRGIKIETLSLGFGAPLLSLDRGGIRYQIAAFPVGGYVKFAGEYDEKNENFTPAPDEFFGAHWATRALIALAGPLSNFIFPVLVLFALYATVGLPFFISPPQVMEVSAGSAAEEAGLKKGDQIIKVDGAWTFDVKAMVRQIDDAARIHPAQETRLSVLRDSKLLEIKALSRLDHDSGKYRLGVAIQPGPAPVRKLVEKVDASSPAEKAGFMAGDEVLSVGGKLLKQGNDFPEQFADAPVDAQGLVSIEVARLGRTLTLSTPKKQPLPDGIDPRLVGLIGLNLERNTELSGQQEKRYERIGIWGAARASLYENYYTTVAMVSGIVDLALGRLPFKESVGGPVAIVRMAHQAAESGLFELARLAMNISLILGIMNLLPIPMLDGGTMLLCLLEGARRKPLSIKTQTLLQNVFGAILIAFMLFVVYNDLASSFIKR